MRMGSSKCRRQLPDLAGSFDDVFVAGQLLQTHRAAGVEPVGADTDLCPESEFATVVESGRCVPENNS